MKADMQTCAQKHCRSRTIKARGLCNTCYAYALKHDQLDEYERKQWDRSELVAAYRQLRSEGKTPVAAAMTLGVDVRAVYSAVGRQRRFERQGFTKYVAPTFDDDEA